MTLRSVVLAAYRRARSASSRKRSACEDMPVFGAISRMPAKQPVACRVPYPPESTVRICRKVGAYLRRLRAVVRSARGPDHGPPSTLEVEGHMLYWAVV